jgi:hypothetical protein
MIVFWLVCSFFLQVNRLVCSMKWSFISINSLVSVPQWWVTPEFQRHPSNTVNPLIIHIALLFQNWTNYNRLPYWNSDQHA